MGAVFVHSDTIVSTSDFFDTQTRLIGYNKKLQKTDRTEVTRGVVGRTVQPFTFCGESQVFYLSSKDKVQQICRTDIGGQISSGTPLSPPITPTLDIT